MTLGELMRERGLSNADVAALLAEQGVTIERGPTAGKPVTPKGVGRRTNDPVPPRWRAALGYTEPDEAVASAGVGEPAEGASEAPKGRREKPPRRPAEAAFQIAVEPGASRRIAGAYRFAGAALAAGSGSQGIAAVWDDQADNIADLWVKAAEQNPWAARFVTMMQSGGTMGDLAAAHLYLAGATLYVIGAGIPGGDAIFAKYARYRPVAPVDAGTNGHQPAEPAAGEDDRSASGSVVDG